MTLRGMTLARPEQLIVMGVSGSGKTTLGRALAAQLGVKFLDAADFHPPEARARMERSEGLTDAERLPWLVRLRAELDACAARSEGVVLTRLEVQHG
jgi:gluconokinase